MLDGRWGKWTRPDACVNAANRSGREWRGQFQYPLREVRVQPLRAARRHVEEDPIANRTGDCAKVRRILAEPLLRALKIIDVGIDPTPADKIGLPILNRRRSDLEPAIRSVEAAKALFRHASFLGLPDISQLRDLPGPPRLPVNPSTSSQSRRSASDRARLRAPDALSSRRR